MHYQTVLIGWVAGFLFLGSVTYRYIHQHPYLSNTWRTLFNLVIKIILPFTPFALGIISRDVMGLGQNISAPDFWAGFALSRWFMGIKLTLLLMMVSLAALWALRPSAIKSGTARPCHHAIYDEVHWLFYRAVPVLVLNDLFYGNLIGSGLIWLELLMRNNNRAPAITTNLYLLVSTTLYFVTQNIWLMLAAHLMLEYAANYFAKTTENKRFIIKGQ